MRLVILCVRVYKHPMTELNRKLIESTPRRCLLQDVETSENYLCKNLVGEEGGGQRRHVIKSLWKCNEFTCRVEEQG